MRQLYQIKVLVLLILLLDWNIRLKLSEYFELIRRNGMLELVIFHVFWVYFFHVRVSYSMLHSALVLDGVYNLLEELPVADGVTSDQHDLLFTVHTQLCANGIVCEHYATPKFQEIRDFLRKCLYVRLNRRVKHHELFTALPLYPEVKLVDVVQNERKRF